MERGRGILQLKGGKKRMGKKMGAENKRAKRSTLEHVRLLGDKARGRPNH